MRIRSKFAFLLLFLFFASASLADGIETLSAGAPKWRGVALAPSSYVEVKAKRLAQPKVLWLNFQLLREAGIDIPHGGLTPEFEKQVLDTFAYAIPGPKDAPALFTKQEKTFYADRYGGGGIGRNWGSGRAASAGKIQIKGIGVTPLVGAGMGFDHSHGRASLEEAMREAVWGEMSQELPHGANRVVAIIDTGTYTEWKDGGLERNALIIREDPVRPAHYMRQPLGNGSFEVTDPQRTRDNVRLIAKFLPVLPEKESAALPVRLEAGLNEYVDRVAEQFAAAYTQRFYHGATSSSNFEISGKFIDYGTMTAQPGYGGIKILESQAPAGITYGIQYDLILGPANDLRVHLPKELIENVPDDSALMSRFDELYESRLVRGALTLVGTPADLVTKLETTDEGKKLAEVIWRVAKDGAKELSVDKVMPKKVSSYDIKAILTAVVDQNPNNLKAIRAAVRPHLPPKLAATFSEAYQKFVLLALHEAQKDGIAPKALMTAISERAHLVHREIPELYRPKMRKKNYALIEDYQRTGNRSIIWDSIDSTIANSRRFYRDTNPYQVILNESRDGVSGREVRYFFDFRSSEYQLVMNHAVSQGSVNFYGHQIPLTEAESAKLRVTTDNWKSSHEIRGAVVGDRMEFQMTVPAQAKDVQFTLRSADGKKWWKSGEQDFVHHFRTHPAVREHGNIKAPVVVPPKAAFGKKCVDALRQLANPAP